MTLNLSHLLEISCSYQPDEICASLLGKKCLTYRQASASLAQHTVWLELQIRRSIAQTNDVVIAYLSNNSIDLFLSVLACSKEHVKALPALLNTRWTASEIASALQSQGNSAVTFLLYGPEFRERTVEIVKLIDHPVIPLPIPSFALEQIIIKPSTKEVTQKSNRTVQAPLFSSQYSQTDAVIVFTSGTSKGRPKGVRLSHRAIAIQCGAKCKPPCGYSRQTKLLASTVPFFHIGGLSSLLAVWMAGGQIVLPTETHAAGFDPEMTWRSPSNTLVVVPAMLFILQQYREKVMRQPNDSVQLILVGGQSITPSQKLFLREAFPSARVVQTYACTEAASSLTFHQVLPARDLSVKNNPTGGDCVGSPPDHIEICLIDKDLWKEHCQIRIIEQPWSSGIIATRGAHVMNGYWKRGHTTQPSRGLDQWFVTNDLAYWDEEGRLYFCGRVNDSIRTGGETVLSSEVERVLQRHPKVDECAVFPVPDTKFGQAVACAIVPSEPGLTLQQIRQWCHEHGLSNYKHPRQLFLMKQLPKNSSGKTLKFLLTEQFSPQTSSRL